MEKEIEAALDLRAFLERAREAGELQEIAGAHWKLEIGALTEIFAEPRPTPALLFDDIVDYPHGYRVLSNILHSPRCHALALGRPPKFTRISLVRSVKERLDNFKPLPLRKSRKARFWKMS